MTEFTDVRVTVRVGAYILRKNTQGLYQILLFQHPDDSEAPIQVPGGGVDRGEEIEAALHREIWEESGLRHLKIWRKLGKSETCWIYPRKQVSHRHLYLLLAPPELPDTWEHIVQGTGVDAGMRFWYFWDRPSREFTIPGGLGAFLNPESIPELYDITSDDHRG